MVSYFLIVNQLHHRMNGLAVIRTALLTNETKNAGIGANLDLMFPLMMGAKKTMN